MAKTCRSCGYNPIGPFIDNCPMCGDPVRHLAHDAGRAWSANPLVRRAVIALLIAGMLVVGRWVLRERDRGPAANGPQWPVGVAKERADRRTRAEAMFASRLVREFQTDPRAEQRYDGKYLEVAGIVERRGKDRDGTPFVVLNGGLDDTLKIECFFDTADEADEARIEQLPTDRMVSVNGQYTGRISHLQFHDCVLVK